MKIALHAQAVADIEAIRAWIAEDSPSAADRVVERIFANLDRLTEYPEIGRLGRVEGTRELVVPRLPFIVVYEVDRQREVVAVLAVFHAARQR